MDTLISFWTNMFKWQGTATRKSYWIPTITYSIIYNLLFYSSGISITGMTYLTFNSTNLLMTIISTVLFIAQFTLTARRLHDTKRSAIWMLLAIIPVIGWIALIVLLCQPTK